MKLAKLLEEFIDTTPNNNKPGRGLLKFVNGQRPDGDEGSKMQGKKRKKKMIQGIKKKRSVYHWNASQVWLERRKNFRKWLTNGTPDDLCIKI